MSTRVAMHAAKNDHPAGRWRRVARRAFRIAWGAMALLFLLEFALGLFGVPRRISSWFTGADIELSGRADVIVVLGGGGIPSESGLMRCYCAAELATAQTNALVVVALPADGEPGAAHVGRMKDELVMRGVSVERIRMEHEGRHTREQALKVREMLPDMVDSTVAVVSSPSHIRRAVLCFRKAGFRRVAAMPARSVSVDADLGRGTHLRYQFWSNVQWQVELAREAVVMVVYKLRGWI